MDIDDCEYAISDPHQDWPRKILSPATVQYVTQAITYTGSTRVGKNRGKREISKEDTTTLPQDQNTAHPLSLMIIQTGHSERRDDSPPTSSRDRRSHH